MDTDLTDAQAMELADAIEGELWNEKGVYEVATGLFGFKPCHLVFDQMKTVASVAQCPDCGAWTRFPKPIWNYTSTPSCGSCEEEQFDDDEEDE